MMRPLRAVTMVVILVVSGARSSAQPSSRAPRAQAALTDAKQLNDLVEKLYGEGKFTEAVVPAERALALREQALGPSHPDVATSLNNLAALHQAQGAYAKAARIHRRALAIREKVLEPSHPDVSESLNNLAALYRAQGAYGKAESLHLRALAAREKALGPSHPDVAQSLNNLAELYRAQGTYAKAESLHLRALAVREMALGLDHPDVAQSLNNLAGHYRDQGAYAKAAPLYTRALAIYEKALGPSHTHVATSLNNLASLYYAEGAYAQAEPLYLRAVNIHEKTLGRSHPDVATSLNNLALLYTDQGAYAQAEPLYVRALAIREKALGPSHPHVAISLASLASLYRAQGAYDKAESFYLRALAIDEKALGPGHPEVAASLNNLAVLYKAQGLYAQAGPLYLRALAIREKALGPGHRDVANSLHNLAGLHRDQGGYAKAEPLYTRALATYEMALGRSHPLVATNLNNLARLYQAQGMHSQAEPLIARAAEIREQQLRTELVRLSEPRKRALMTLLQDETETVVSLHADAMPSSVSALELALTTVLRRKGRILDSMVDSDTRIRSHLTPQLRALLDQLAEARSELVAQLYSRLGSPARAALTATRERIDELESALSAASAEFRTQVEPVTLAKVRATLPAGTALVELVRYRRFDPRQPQTVWQEERYVAYLLTAEGPQWVALGPAASIDVQIDAVLRAIHGKAGSEITRAELQRLDALVLAPMRAQLSGISHLILAPDDKLNLVPFEALVDREDHHALESYLISYVTTGRDLLRSATPRPPRSSAVVIAGPDYGPLPEVRRPGMVLVTPLPGALAEATDLSGYFATAPLTGRNATKSALAMLRGPAMLHIATHGFYARAPRPSPPAPTPHGTQPSVGPRAESGGVRDMVLDGGHALVTPPALRDELADALDRSGLAMAGANLGPDGIVTAREIAGLDLWGTQLAVLSACETGVGTVASGDGVYGLRRALVLAGAASQVVSLWNVSDTVTRGLMRDYYGYLARGIGRAEALRQAKRQLLTQPRYAHPYYWAAFIPAGDWRPLDKTAFSPRKPQP